MGEFKLDTSGVVRNPTSVGYLQSYRWPDLSPFMQGYIEALLSGPVARWPDDNSTAEMPGFSDLSPETLARIMEDCERSHSFWCMPHDRQGGEHFWKLRQAEPAGSTFPPVAPHLNPDGKVSLSEAQAERAGS